MYAMQNTLAVSQLDPNTFVRYKSRYEKRMFTALLGVMTNNLSDEIERKHPELS